MEVLERAIVYTRKSETGPRGDKGERKGGKRDSAGRMYESRVRNVDAGRSVGEGLECPT